MYERTLHAAERLLQARTSGTMRVTELWASIGTLARTGGCEDCTLADFAALLDADPRFELINADRSDDEGDDGDVTPADDDLRSMGFLKAASVRLRRHTVVVEDDDDEVPSLSLRHLSETTPPKPRTGPEARTPATSKRGRSGPSRPVKKRVTRRTR